MDEKAGFGNAAGGAFCYVEPGACPDGQSTIASGSGLIALDAGARHTSYEVHGNMPNYHWSSQACVGAMYFQFTGRCCDRAKKRISWGRSSRSSYDV